MHRLHWSTNSVQLNQKKVRLQTHNAFPNLISYTTKMFTLSNFVNKSSFYFLIISGEQKIIGVFRTMEKGADKSTTYDERLRMWSKRNISAIASSLGMKTWQCLGECRH